MLQYIALYEQDLHTKRFIKEMNLMPNSMNCGCDLCCIPNYMVTIIVKNY